MKKGPVRTRPISIWVVNPGFHRAAEFNTSVCFCILNGKFKCPAGIINLPPTLDFDYLPVRSSTASLASSHTPQMSTYAPAAIVSHCFMLICIITWCWLGTWLWNFNKVSLPIQKCNTKYISQHHIFILEHIDHILQYIPFSCGYYRTLLVPYSQ